MKLSARTRDDDDPALGVVHPGSEAGQRAVERGQQLRLRAVKHDVPDQSGQCRPHLVTVLGVRAQAKRVTGRIGVDRAATATARQSDRPEVVHQVGSRGAVVDRNVEVHLLRVRRARPGRAR